MIYTMEYPNGIMSADTDKALNRCIKGFPPYVRTSDKEDRIKLIEFLESRGFWCIENDTQCRTDIVESGLPLTINLNEKTISCMGNVTCAAAAASQKILINSALFHELYREWENLETEMEETRAATNELVQ